MTDWHFLRHIRQSPRDLTRRLVYADWLEEIGDSRAEYLRVECEFAQISLLSPTYQDLWDRRKILREQVDADWREELGYVDYYLPMFHKLPVSRMERWRRMDRLLDYWFDDEPQQRRLHMDELRAAEARLGSRLPTAVREFYLLFGNALGRWTYGRYWLPLHEIHITDNKLFLCSNELPHLVFGHVNQHWGCMARDCDLDDPPYYQFATGFDWKLSEELSQVTMAMLLESTCGRATHRLATDHGYAQQRPDAAQWWERVLRYFPRCAVELRNGAYLYEGRDLLVNHQINQGVSLALREPEAYQGIPELLQEFFQPDPLTTG